MVGSIRRALWACIVLATWLFLSACASEDEARVLDAGSDATLDAPSDAPLDAAPDAPSTVDPQRCTVTVAPASVTADGKAQATITITLLDGADQPVAGLATQIAATGSGDTVGQAAASDSQGVATGTLTSTVAEVKTITVTVTTGAGPVQLAAEPSVQFVAGAPTQIVFTQQPSSVVAGAAISPAPSVAVEDAHGNLVDAAASISIAIGANPGSATLGGTLAVAASGGEAGFADLTLDKPGSGYTLVASSSGLATATSATFTVTPGAAASFRFDALSPTATAGLGLDFTLTALDALGNVATAYAGTPSITTTDPTASLPPPHTFGAADAGRFAYVGLVLRAGGTTTIAAQDGSVTGSAMVSVSGANATQLVLAFAAPPVACAPATLIVTATDPFGNVDTHYTSTCRFTSTDPRAALPPDYAFVVADAGVHAFPSVQFAATGGESVTASDVFTPTISGTAVATVAPGPAVALAFAGLPGSVMAGQAIAFTLSAVDACGNVAATFLGTPVFTSSDAKAVLPPAHTFTAADKGVFTYAGLSFETAGVQTLQIAAGAVAAPTASLSVSAGRPAHLLVTGLPNPSPQNAPGTVTVSVTDPFGNAIVGYTGTVAFTSTDPKATLPAAYAFTAADAGAHTFTGGVTFATVGSETVTATDTTSSISGAETVTVNPTGIEWAKRAGCSSCFMDPFQFAVFPDGSFVVAGLFAGAGGSSPLDQPVLGPGESNQTTLTPPSDTGEIFVARYHADGTLAWAKQAGGLGDDHGLAVRILPNGVPLVTGEVTTSSTNGGGSVVFGAGEPKQTSVTSSAGSVMFQAQFDPADGTLASVSTAGGTTSTDHAEGEAIAMYPDGSTTICVSVIGSAVFGAGTANQTTLTTPTGEALALAHYDATGAFVWAKLFQGTTTTDELYGGHCVETADGGLLVTGGIVGHATLGTTTLTAAGAEDAFFARFDASGDPVWAASASVSSTASTNQRSAWGTGVVALPDASAIVSGAFLGNSATGASLSFGATQLVTAASFADASFLVRFAPDGSLAWVKLMDGVTGTDSVETGAATLLGTTVVVGGTYGGGSSGGNVVFGRGEAGQTTLPGTAQNFQMFLAAFDPTTGDLVWAKPAAAGPGGAFLRTGVQAVAARPDGTLLLGGEFIGTAQFGPDDATPIQLASVGDDDLAISAWWPY